MTSLILRNLRLYFRDKSAVFFSMLGVLIIIALYLLFLGDVWIESMDELEGVKALMGNWIIAGVVAVTGVTSAMGALGVMVDDRTKGIFRDFSAAPMRRSALVGGYVCAAYIISVVMSLFALVLGQAYILLEGGSLLGIVAAVQVLGIILLNGFLCAAFVFLVVCAFRSSSAYGAASTIIGTLSGFLMGIYLPIGQLPNAVQWVIKLFPISHSGVLLRQVMMQAPMDTTFAGAPAELSAGFRQLMGVEYTVGGTVMPAWAHILVIVLSGFIFAAIAVAVMSKKRRNSL